LWLEQVEQMALGRENVSVARTNCGADVFCLTGFLRDDDLVSHNGLISKNRLDSGGMRTYSEQYGLASYGQWPHLGRGCGTPGAACLVTTCGELKSATGKTVRASIPYARKRTENNEPHEAMEAKENAAIVRRGYVKQTFFRRRTKPSGIPPNRLPHRSAPQATK